MDNEPAWPGSARLGESQTPFEKTEEQPTFEETIRLEGRPVTPWDVPPILPAEEPRAARRPGRGVRAVVVPLLAALVGSAVGTGVTLVATNRDVTGGAAVIREATRTGGATELTGVAAVAKSVMPSIVLIEISGEGGFLGRVQGNGSGVVYRSDGYIITNNHVIENADEITVKLSTGESLPARVVGTAAPGDDIAVIKVDKTGLTPAVLGSIKDTNVGDLAIAIGSPFGLQGTVTAGVISAIHRNINLGGERITDAIQTDAPINPGNSGGALVNGRGEVVGINTAIVGGSGGNVGVGFAIPIDIARRDADQIIKTGRAERPFIGITGESLPNEGGAVLQGVEPGGPAADAGLRADDIIVAIDGEKIGSMDDLISVLNRHNVGDTVSVTYVRGGRRNTVKVKLAARPNG